jgi:hypothetical protein
MVASSRWKTELRTSAAWCNSGICRAAAIAGRTSLRRCSGTVRTWRLAGAEPLLAKPIAITHIPYGYIRRTTEDGLYCIGDQAAVIPSFTGDGISIALHTARCAAAAYLAAESAPIFQAKLRSALLAQMRLAELAAGGLNNSLARAVLPFCLRVWPGVMRVTARLTRVAQHAAVAPHAVAWER